MCNAHVFLHRGKSHVPTLSRTWGIEVGPPTFGLHAIFNRQTSARLSAHQSRYVMELSAILKEFDLRGQLAAGQLGGTRERA